MTRYAYPLARLLSFFIPLFLATNYTLNHFYVRGGYMLDSGWFAHLAAYGTEWPLPNPPAIGDSYFTTHFSPAFYLLALPYQALAMAGVDLPAAAWFSVTQGLWFGLLGLAVFLLIATPEVRPARAALALTIALAASFNGVSLATIGFPHFEIGIPALLLLFLALLWRGQPVTGGVALLLGLLLREDSGLHYFGALIVLAIALCWVDRTVTKQVKILAMAALLCLLYSIGVLVFQKSNFSSGDNALVRVYLGEPAFAHVDLAFIVERARFYLNERLYLVAPLALLLVIAWRRRDLLLTAGVVTVAPWIVFSMLAISSEAGQLTSYYAFPVVIGILWPALVLRLNLVMGRLPPLGNHPLLVVASVCLVSTVGFITTSEAHDKKPWQHFLPSWLGAVHSTQTGVKAFVTAHVGDTALVVDDATASLATPLIGPDNWSYQLALPGRDRAAIETVAFLPGGWLTPVVRDIINDAQLDRICRIGTTRFLAASRHRDLEHCEPFVLPTDQPIPGTSTLFDFYPGWSHAEAEGRWTVGERAVFPPFLANGASGIELCFTGHAYLPTPDSQITATVEVNGNASTTDGWEFNQQQQASPTRCHQVATADISAGSLVQIALRLEGISSPQAHQQSSDARRLGVYLKTLSVKPLD